MGSQQHKQRKPSLVVVLIIGIVLIAAVVGAILIIRGNKTGSAEAETNPPATATQTPAQSSAQPQERDDVSEMPKTPGANPYNEFYYYESARQKRYEKYAKKHKDLTPDEVVWQVNVDLDKPDFKAKKVEDPHGLTILVNKHFKLSADFEPKNLVSVGGKEMTKTTADHYKKLAAAASKKNLPLTVMSAYRSYDYQKGVHQRYANRDGEAAADRFSARAGYSEHQTGRAIDLVAPGGKLMTFKDTPQCEWVHKNAWKYGFIIRYPADQTDITRYMYESWHITYVGEDAARTMHDEKIATLEEYVVKYVDHTPPADPTK